MVMIDVGNPKMAREHIALLQSAVAFGNVKVTVDTAPMMAPIYKMLSDMLQQLDEHRPLGSDGKHGDRHTDTCGCTDVTKYVVVINGVPLKDSWYQLKDAKQWIADRNTFRKTYDLDPLDAVIREAHQVRDASGRVLEVSYRDCA